MMGSMMMGAPGWGFLLWLVPAVVLLLAALVAGVWLLRSVAGPNSQIGPISAMATPRAGTLTPRRAALLVTDPGAPPELRASDADREHIAQALSAHLASGRLTLLEFEERVGAAYAAQTLGQLRAQLDGLPVTAG